MRNFEIDRDEDGWRIAGLKDRERDVLDVAIVVEEEADDPYLIDLYLANVLRDHPAETVMRDGVAAAIRSVPGVNDVAEEDRETWFVRGRPDPEALLRAVAGFLDSRFDYFLNAVDEALA